MAGVEAQQWERKLISTVVEVDDSDSRPWLLFFSFHYRSYFS